MDVRHVVLALGSVGLIAASLTAGGCYSGSSGNAAGNAGTDTDNDTGLDSAGTGDAQCEGAGLGPAPLPRLTRADYRRAVRDLVGVDVDVSGLGGDERLGPFAANVSTSVAAADVRAYQSVAETVAAAAVQAIDGLLPCESGDTSVGCVGAFIDDFALRALRRPVSAAQRERLLVVFEHGRDALDFSFGIELVISAVLQDPNFLYRIELGTADPQDPSQLTLDAYEVATRMSFFLWGSVPDLALLDAAAADELATPEQRVAQAERMLADPRARAGVGRIYAQWFGATGVGDALKDSSVFPDFTPELAKDMEREVAATSALLVLDEGAGLETLLLSTKSLVTPELASFYGVDIPAGASADDGLFAVSLPAAERAGMLTRGGVMAHYAHADQTAPVQRGRFLREAVLCQPMPDPPPDVDDTVPAVDPTASARERFSEHRANPSCAACHALLDPVGFAFEHYDGAGKFRVMDGPVPVDASGDLTATWDADGPFADAVELSQRLAVSEEVRQCAVRQHATLALVRTLDAEGADQCLIEQLDQGFADSGDELSALLTSIIARSDFATRRIAEAPAGS